MPGVTFLSRARPNCITWAPVWEERKVQPWNPFSAPHVGLGRDFQGDEPSLGVTQNDHCVTQDGYRQSIDIAPKLLPERRAKQIQEEMTYEEREIWAHIS